VINPFETIDHLNPDPVGRIADTLPVFADGQPEVNSNKEERKRLAKGSFFTSDNISINYTITFQKPEYSKREKVKIEISAKDLAGNPVETDMSVSVTKSIVVNPTAINLFPIIWRSLKDTF
jgi:hypothetical protein